MKKSILFKIWKFPQLSETFIVNQIILAIKLGYEVKVLVGELNDIPENSNNSLFESYKLRDKIIIEDYKIPQHKANRLLKASWLLLSNISLVPHLIRFYNCTNKKRLGNLFEFFFYKNFRDYNTIHIQFGTNKHPIDILKYTGFIKSQVIASFHGHDLYFPINNRIPNNGYYNHLFQSASYLVANTVFLKDKLTEINAPVEKIKIIPVSVNTSIFTPIRSDGHISDFIRIISVGRLEIFKGHQYGIKCISELIKKGYKIKYSIIGDGSQKAVLENLIQTQDLKNHVELLGRRTQEEISKILPTQDIFLMTSITDPNYGVESQGLVTAEAQACGLPVVAFDTGGVRYTLVEGKTGFLCREMDIKNYTARVELLITDKALRAQMGINARKFIEKNFSEKSVLSEWKKLYG